MRKIIVTMALLVLFASPAALAQTGSGAGISAGKANPATSPSGKPTTEEAPIGHRQPRADQVPPENNLSNPNDPINREDAALDRKIKSICRGC
jgi:hypothetical protein